jgi:hypothetical protein
VSSAAASAFFSVVARMPIFQETAASVALQTRPHSVMVIRDQPSHFVVYTLQAAPSASALDAADPDAVRRCKSCES